MNDMASAPKTGERILLKYIIVYNYLPDGKKWEECFWDEEYQCDYPQRIRGRWTPWCGNERTRSTHTIIWPLGWLPLPE